MIKALPKDISAVSCELPFKFHKPLDSDTGLTTLIKVVEVLGARIWNHD